MTKGARDPIQARYAHIISWLVQLPFNRILGDENYGFLPAVLLMLPP